MFDSVECYRTVGEVIRAIALNFPPEIYNAFGVEPTITGVVWRGYKAIQVHLEQGESESTLLYVLLDCPADTGIGPRAALSGDGAAYWSGITQTLGQGNYRTLPQIVASVTAWMAEVALIVDHLTLGSSGTLVINSIDAADGRVFGVTAYLPVAADAEWLGITWQSTTGNVVEFADEELVYAEPGKPLSQQVAGGSTAAAVEGLKRAAQALEDIAHKTTIVGLNDTGPIWVVESSEIVTGP